MRRPQKLVVSAFAATAVLAVQPIAAVAHPHMWVIVETTVLYDHGAFTGLKEKWTFDEFYTAYAIEGLDKNHDGIYDREELSGLAKVNIEAMKDVGYFTYPVLAGTEVKLTVGPDYWLEHKDGKLSLYFTVLFDRPILTEAADFAFAVDDPTFFIAFELAKTDPVHFAKGTPRSCKARIGVRNDETGDAERLAKAFARLASPIRAAQAVAIDCTGHAK
jgi:ABC-type uncharacterized transport system substrate-binding protein